MHEHRRIERMVEMIGKEKNRVREGGEPDVHFLSSAADFFSFYADRCHHGKEEDILFRELNKKDIPEELDRIMRRLIEDHKKGRGLVGRLRKAYSAYHTDDDPEGAKSDIAGILDDLAELYPPHIRTEDKEFFFPCMELFSKQEKDDMLEEMYEFDRNLIHEKYEHVLGEFEEKGA
jgi:hemerythrin-like domain-containing protein